jgi:DNA-binding CsgD family transcriptional regulator
MEKMNGFTARDIVLMQLLCLDKRTAEIATYLKISPRTVEAERDRLRKKLGFNTVAGLAVFAVINGIYDPVKHADRAMDEQSKKIKARKKHRAIKR